MALRDSSGNFLDGQTLVIEPPRLTVNEVIITQESSDLLSTKLTANADNFCSIHWFDSQGVCIGDGKSIRIVYSPKKTLITAVASDIEGDIAYRTVSVNRPHSINSLSISLNRILSIEFSCPARQSTVRITSVKNSSYQIIERLEDGVEGYTIDLSALPPGYYILEYITEGNTAESRTIVLN